MWTVFGYDWYKGKPIVPFQFYNDADVYLQMDKVGHTYSSYLFSYAGYHWLRHAGVSKRNALIYGGGLGVMSMAPIEITDGLFEGWGFSWYDMIANAAGSGVVIGQALLTDDEPLKMKMTMWPSDEARVKGEDGTPANVWGDTFVEQFVNDYNNRTFWLSFQANKLFLPQYLPDWVSLSAGYGCSNLFDDRGSPTYFDGVKLPDPDEQRIRRYLVSLDVDWTKIPVESKFWSAILKGMFTVKLPFPALEVDSKGRFRGYWLYY